MPVSSQLRGQIRHHYDVELTDLHGPFTYRLRAAYGWTGATVTGSVCMARCTGNLGERLVAGVEDLSGDLIDAVDEP